MQNRIGTLEKQVLTTHNLVSEGEIIDDEAYPDANSDLTEILALEAFINSLNDSDIRLRLRECCPKSIADAETIAVRLETHCLVDRQRLQSVNAISHGNRSNIHSDSIESVMRKIDILTEKVEKLDSEQHVKGPLKQTYDSNSRPQIGYPRYNNINSNRSRMNHMNSNYSGMNRLHNNQYNNNNSYNRYSNRYNTNRSQYNGNRYRNDIRQKSNNSYNGQNKMSENENGSSWGTATRPNQM
ncbi:hypothetical protein ACF0H5_010019 [Mactra antiquata]